MFGFVDDIQGKIKLIQDILPSPVTASGDEMPPLFDFFQKKSLALRLYLPFWIILLDHGA